MRKIRVLLAAVVTAIPLALIPAQPAGACDRYPCQPSCDVNTPEASVDESGTVAITMPARLIDCYY